MFDRASIIFTFSINKAIYQAKPKLKVWNADIKVALKEKRNSYNIWLKNGKPNDPTNHLLLQKKHNKKEFRNVSSAFT
jgi:hypothetical protein